MDERTIEAHLRRRVKERGGKHRKVVYQGRNGSPDDWCFFPGGLLLIFECKATGENPRPDQWKEIETLRDMGQLVFVVDSVYSIDSILSNHLDVDMGNVIR